MTSTVKDCNIALLGLGNWGKNIMRNLYALGALRVACDSNLKILKQRQKDFPEVHCTAEYDEVLHDPQIKAVVIAVPAANHYEIAKRAILAGKDVLIEKPLSLQINHGRELVNLAREKKVILMVGHLLQYHPAIRELKKIIDDGVLGKVQYLYSNRLNIGTLRVEENILWSFAPHDISVMLMLIGEDPVSISGTGESYLTEGLYDITLTTLEFRNRIRGHIFVSWLHPFKEQKLIVVGSKAMAVFDDLTSEKLFLYPHRIEWEEGKIPVAHKADFRVIDIEKKEPLKEEMLHFIDCIRSRKEPKTNGEEGLRVLSVLEKTEKAIEGTKSNKKLQKKREYYVHETSCIDEDVTVGAGTKIWHFSHILKNVKIGKNCILGQNVSVASGVTIGNGCKLQNNVSVYNGVVLEDDVFCGPSCVFTNVYNPRAFIERKHEFRKTLVMQGATIGANATIVCGNSLGRYSFVGAGAVVKRDVPDYAVVVGIPARQIGWACKCGVVLSFTQSDHARCTSCGNEYKINNEILEAIKEN